MGAYTERELHEGLEGLIERGLIEQTGPDEFRVLRHPTEPELMDAGTDPFEVAGEPKQARPLPVDWQAPRELREAVADELAGAPAPEDDPLDGPRAWDALL